MALLDFRSSPHGGMQKHLPEWQSQPRITPTTLIDHSIVGSGLGAWNMFRDRSSLESHFIVLGRRSGANDGFIWQLMDTDRQADANLQANGYGISFETEDDGDPDRQPWTTAQLESLIWAHEECRRIHPTIPRRESRSCSDPGGLGYHTLHGAPSCWTPVSKSCPGTVRKRQWRAALLPAFLAGTTTTATEEWWEMADIPAANLAQIKAVAEEAIRTVWNLKTEVNNPYGTTNNDDFIKWLYENVRATKSEVTQNKATFLAMAEAGFNVDLTAVEAGIVATVGEAVRETLEGVEIGGGASAEEIANAVARLAGERLTAQATPAA